MGLLSIAMAFTIMMTPSTRMQIRREQHARLAVEHPNLYGVEAEAAAANSPGSDRLSSVTVPQAAALPGEAYGQRAVAQSVAGESASESIRGRPATVPTGTRSQAAVAASLLSPGPLAGITPSGHHDTYPKPEKMTASRLRVTEVDSTSNSEESESELRESPKGEAAAAAASHPKLPITQSDSEQLSQVRLAVHDPMEPHAQSLLPHVSSPTPTRSGRGGRKARSHLPAGLNASFDLWQYHHDRNRAVAVAAAGRGRKATGGAGQ